MELGKDTRQSILNGVNKVANAVKATAGARGKFALIEDLYGLVPHSTKDGITVLKAVSLEDQYEKLGGELLKQAVIKTNNQTEDGTTTTTILSQALINETFNQDDSVSHVELINGMNVAFKDTVKLLDKLKKEVSYKEMVEVATISANGDKEIGEKIAEIYRNVGTDATIEVKEGLSKTTDITYNEGIRLDRGWAYPHFSTDFKKFTVNYDECLVLLYNDKIKILSDIAKGILQAKEERLPLIIIADDVEQDVVRSLVKMKQDGEVQVCLCYSPEYGDYRKQIMEDIAIVSKAKVCDNNFNYDYELGYLKKFTATSEKAILLTEDTELLNDRIEELKEMLEDSEESVKLRLKQRIANLKSAVVEVSVGGITDLEIREKKDRIDDAIPALRVALEEGFIAGGGSTLAYISTKLKNKLSGGEAIGYNCLVKALQEPMRVILENGGKKDYQLPEKYGYGTDVLDGKNKNMLKAGIIDPVKVTKIALENAVSVASTALSTEVLIVTKSL